MDFAYDDNIKKDHKSISSPLATAKMPIQRHVGFEFEISWRTYKAKSGKMDEAMQNPGPENSDFLKKKDQIFQSDTFEVQADETTDNQSDFEVITIPFSEDASGLEELRTTGHKLVDFFQQMELVSKASPTKCITLEPMNRFGVVTMDDAFVKPNFPFVITPQMTAGFRLSEIPDFLQDIFPTEASPYGANFRTRFGQKAVTRSHLKDFFYEKHYRSNVANGEIPNKVEAGRKKFLANHPDLPPWSMSPNLRGLLCLIVHYLDSCSKLYLTYPKSAMNLLARTDFAEMFKVLPLKERIYFGPKHPERWLRLVKCCHPYMSWKDPVFKHGVYKDAKDEKDKHILDEVTIQKWLQNIPRGVDMLSKHHFPNFEHAHHLESMGEYRDKTDPGGGTNTTRAPIIEIRGMETIDKPEVLPRWMENAWKMIYALNNRLNLKYGEPFEIDEDKLEVFCAKPPPFRP
ncbi:hypothetical protein [Aureibacter tunicatorum]|uniref:Uncharacterized protein n=1 Tax=Aureibacter tunicatorum TaxID=866807 RepID=A0AAE3XLC3_9BACT|nr:hypothetical protein [Aureibacter tunicatorum]MDR6237886.1 hypothetical protein [Aureibacter tunicatorum]BDD02921.1 hypothetical protein AUTU_04040 [Aureibacter tunicatorum]